MKTPKQPELVSDGLLPTSKQLSAGIKQIFEQVCVPEKPKGRSKHFRARVYRARSRNKKRR